MTPTHTGGERERETDAEWVQPAVPASGNDKRYAPTAAEALGAAHVNLGGRAGDYGRMIVSGAEAYKAAPRCRTLPASRRPGGRRAQQRTRAMRRWTIDAWMQDMRSHGVVLRRSTTYWMESTSSCSVQA